ncbi:MAG TPA: SdrD B-like domain-containing protein, partial [Candidatus Latescibacteria bacterium]|nr:SdrD B-like domain-containing protein [Candidatus Latescibacterota bacterium]
MPGATVVIASDHQRDHEPPSTGGELLGFTPSTQTTAFGEAPGNRIATVTTDSLVSIGDYVWYDNDRDGLQGGAKDKPVNGMTVNLRD